MKERKKKAFSDLDSAIMAIMLLIICIVMIMQVIARYIFNSPLVWSEEVARDLFIWMTMIGFSYNARTNNNIEMTLLTDKFSPKVRKCLNFIKNIVGFLLFLFLIFPAISYYKTQIPSVSPTLLFSMGWIGISVPIGMILCTLQYLIHCILDIKSFISKRGGSK